MRNRLHRLGSFSPSSPTPHTPQPALPETRTEKNEEEELAAMCLAGDKSGIDQGGGVIEQGGQGPTGEMCKSLTSAEVRTWEKKPERGIVSGSPDTVSAGRKQMLQQGQKSG